MQANTAIRTLHVTFDLPIFARQISQWRGAFVELAGVENDLFHNHKNDWLDLEAEIASTESIHPITHSPDHPITHHPITPSPNHPITSSTNYHYRYPLIHYRIHKDKASIFAINEGIEALQMTLSSRAWHVTWEGKPRPLQITGMEMNEYDLRMLARPKAYRLYKWLALNEENYKTWLQCNNMVERIQLLERILNSHILAFARGVGWELPERLSVSIQDIQQMQKVTCHGNPLIAFNITYTANILLPPHIALGKAVSHGFGWQKPLRLLKQYAPDNTKRSDQQIQADQ